MWRSACPKARLRTGGMRPQGELEFANGNYYLPTIIEGLNATTCASAQEEIFGPVLVAMQFDRRGRPDRTGQRQRVCAGGRASGRAITSARGAMRARCRPATCGSTPTSSSRFPRPFGGWRDSGLGREKGRLGILQYMEQKSVYWGMNDMPLPVGAGSEMMSVLGHRRDHLRRGRPA
jgi:acyl-CoA reductase-like NAD-dependent aldehyde dehydrogenase